MSVGKTCVSLVPLVFGLAPCLNPVVSVAQPLVHQFGDLSTADRWVLSADPVLTIGTDDGAEPYMLFRVFHGLLLADQRIAIANGGSNEVRIFDQEGRHIESWGRTGEGPGEFQSIFGLIRLRGDTVGVSDGRAYRFSMFVRGDGFVESFNVPASPELVGAVVFAQFADGSYLLHSRAFPLGASGPTRVERDDVNYFRWWPGMDSTRVEATLPGTEFVIAPSGGVRSDGVEVIGRVPRPFGSYTVVAGSTDKWCHAEATTLQVECESARGVQREVFDAEVQPRRVTRDDVERRNQSHLSRLEARPDFQRRLRQAQSEYPDPPEFMPVIGQEMHIGRDGAIWVKLYVPEGSEVEAATWVVFSEPGDEWATVDIPVGIRVLDVGDDVVLGVVRDDLGIERVVLHRIQKQD